MRRDAGKKAVPVSVLYVTMQAALWMTGCGSGVGDAVPETEQTAGEDMVLPEVEVVYAEDAPYPALAEFLTAYYQVPEEERAETRYYYNYVDLNEDGEEEIVVVVVGEYTRVSFGDPALLLATDGESFSVLDSFEGLRTPILICEDCTDGWHDIVYQEYGLGAEDGYRHLRYDGEEKRYLTKEGELLEDMEGLAGVRIISDNFIDDMDQGRYLSLAQEN